MTASATIKVQFTNPAAAAAANAHLSAEVDSRPAGLNAGKSTFIPGATAYVLIYKSANVTVLPAESSAGSFSYGGTASIQYTEELQFADVANATLQVPIDGAMVSYKWIGRDLGAPVVAGDGKTVTVPISGVGVLKVVYNATAIIGALASPASVSDEVDFSILVLIKGEVAA
jgi:hypothetical protein